MKMILPPIVFLGSYLLCSFLYKSIIKFSIKESLGYPFFGVLLVLWAEIRFEKVVFIGYNDALRLLFFNMVIIGSFWLDKRRREKKKARSK